MLDDIVNLIVDNGTAVALLIYFIYKDHKFTDNITRALTSIEESLQIIKDSVSKNKRNTEKKDS